MNIAYAYYKSQDQAQALAAVERFIKLHPNHANVDYMYYLRGLINFNDQISFLNFVYEQDATERDPKATREAYAAFKELVTKFPNSKYTPDRWPVCVIWSMPWRPTKSTWRATTTAAAPTWRQPTAPWAS
jgi:outer membrane assembly lipoprotein YfiO